RRPASEQGRADGRARQGQAGDREAGSGLRGAAGARRDHRTERAGPGPGVLGDRRRHRYRADQARRLRQGRERGLGAARARRTGEAGGPGRGARRPRAVRPRRLRGRAARMTAGRGSGVRRLAGARRLMGALRAPAERRYSGMSLTDLAREFGSDKWGVHRYTPHYERHFAHLRGREMTVLELGIGGYARDQQGGASWRMWKWFFPRADVVGVDIEDKSFVDEERITS